MLPAQTCVGTHCQLTVTEQLTALVLSRPLPGGGVYAALRAMCTLSSPFAPARDGRVA